MTSKIMKYQLVWMQSKINLNSLRNFNQNSSYIKVLGWNMKINLTQIEKSQQFKWSNRENQILAKQNLSHK